MYRFVVFSVENPAEFDFREFCAVALVQQHRDFYTEIPLS